MEQDSAYHPDTPAAREKVATACRILAARGLVDGILGHVSLRVSETELLVRCRGADEPGLANSRPIDVWRVDINGRSVDVPDGYRPPNELPIHTELMRRDPMVRSVVHAHPPAALLAGLAGLNLIVAGQPWGVVYGLGLWVGKAVTLAGVDLGANAFWGAAGNLERLRQSLLTDVTSLTNIGIIAGAFGVAAWRGGLSQPVQRLPGRAWVAAAIAGLALGYASRLAFGCNVGAFFSGISTGSLHGWVWFGAAFLGSMLGVRWRRSLGFEG
jgi:hypothetical protein